MLARSAVVSTKINPSLIILEYIDEAWTNGPSLLPLNPYERSIARFWATFVDDKFLPLLGKIKAAIGKEAKEAFLEKIYEVLLLLEDAFINRSKGKAFFGGYDVGYLDLALGSFVRSTKVFEIEIGVTIFEEAKTPFLVRWTERLYSYSLVKDLMPDPQEYLKLFKKFEAMMEKASSD
ncbi:Glutathione S-transferase U1 [Orobanche minor]